MHLKDLRGLALRSYFTGPLAVPRDAEDPAALQRWGKPPNGAVWWLAIGSSWLDWCRIEGGKKLASRYTRYVDVELGDTPVIAVDSLAALEWFNATFCMASAAKGAAVKDPEYCPEYCIDWPDVVRSVPAACGVYISQEVIDEYSFDARFRWVALWDVGTVALWRPSCVASVSAERLVKKCLGRTGRRRLRAARW